jgi:hypothetical protein
LHKDTASRAAEFVLLMGTALAVPKLPGSQRGFSR